MADNVFDKLDEQSLKIDKLTEQVANITDTLQNQTIKSSKQKILAVSRSTNKESLRIFAKIFKELSLVWKRKRFYKDKTKSVSF